MSAIGGIPQKTDSDMEFSVPDVYEGVPLGSVTVEQRKEEEEEGREKLRYFPLLHSAILLLLPSLRSFSVQNYLKYQSM